MTSKLNMNKMLTGIKNIIINNTILTLNERLSTLLPSMSFKKPALLCTGAYWSNEMIWTDSGRFDMPNHSYSRTFHAAKFSRISFIINLSNTKKKKKI